MKSDVVGRSEDGIMSQTLYTGSVPEHTHTHSKTDHCQMHSSTAFYITTIAGTFSQSSLKPRV